jgi:N-acetylglucosaminyldiphosphoundecaprenol N-acetyl-beta-D-mannosaminyltransferase
VRELVSGVDIVVADGMPLVWACALQGTPLPERIAGSTLTVTLTAAAAQAGASVFLLGGNPGSSERAAQRLMELNPGLDVAGTLCPPFGFENRFDGFDLIVTSLRDADPDIVFVGLGFPKQERLINELREILPRAWFVGCGVSFSFIAGEFKRAPELVQKVGFEWLYRLAQEPRRLARRYVIEGLPFMVALTHDALVVRRATGRRATAALPPASTPRG